MTILQAGVAKSGNTWLQVILRGLLDEAGISRRTFVGSQPIYEVAKAWPLSHANQLDIDFIDIEPSGCVQRISSIFRMPLDDLEGFLRATPHVWTHSRIKPGALGFFRRFDRIVYLVRDPRDVALSMASFALTPYMKRYYPCAEQSATEYLANRLPEMLRAWAVHVLSYLRARKELNLRIVFYEALQQDLSREVADTADFLGFSLSAEAMARIVERASFASMKAKSPEHIRRGTHGKWRTELTGEQRALTRRRLAPLLSALGYALATTDAHTALGVGLEARDLDELEHLTMRRLRPPLEQRLRRSWWALRNG